MHLSISGERVLDVWQSLPRHYLHLSLDACMVMPNHIHGIIQLTDHAAPDGKRAPLSEIVRAFKTYSARRVNLHRGVSGSPVWQRNYYERIIRDDRELEHVRRYIAANPAAWESDPENLRH
jgi:REP element-mobilizing transposase RayT